MKYLFWPGLLAALLFVACKSTRQGQGGQPAEKPAQQEDLMTKTDPFLENLLRSNAQLAPYLAQRDALRIQIIYTRINRDSSNQPTFQSYFFNVNPERYFYPASTVKLPVALLSLQRLNELKIFQLNRESTMITESSYSGQSAVYNDPALADGRPTIAGYIRKIFLVSDNDAYNRLFEFLGQEYINAQLQKMGYTSAQILHRLEIFLSEDENRHTNPVQFFAEDGRTLYQQPMQFNQQPHISRKDSLGNAHYSGGKFVDAPMDFSKKNRFGLQDQHDMLRHVLFPEAAPEQQRFNLAPEDYRFLWQYMSQLPSETIYPQYDSANYPDAYVKFLLFGHEKTAIPKNIRIFNKVGDAYGCLTDNAYMVDFDAQVEFLLSATIYCNSNGVMNDDTYDYDTVGFPFMKALGELIYKYELNRERAFKPDLSKFRLTYDKARY